MGCTWPAISSSTVCIDEDVEPQARIISVELQDVHVGIALSCQLDVSTSALSICPSGLH